MNALIKLPVNIVEDQKEFFELHLAWTYNDPIIIEKKNVFISKTGHSFNMTFKPLLELQPWEKYYDGFKWKFFLGLLIKGIKSKSFSVKNGYYFFCCNIFSGNYFHWLTDTLPKMYFAKRLSDHDPVFVIPFPLMQFHKLSLEALSIKYVVLKKDVNFIKKVSIISCMVKHPGYFHPRLIKNTLPYLMSFAKNSEVSKKRIYITRKKSGRRYLMNEEMILPLLAARNITVYDFDSISFQEQIQLSTESELIISIHGAALTNMIFMEEGSTVIELLPENLKIDKCYFNLSGVMNHFYYYLFCKMDGNSHVTSNYFADINSFNALLQAAIDKKAKFLS